MNKATSAIVDFINSPTKRARNTPQLFAIDPQGVLRYAGAIDDKPTSKAKDVKTAQNYLKAALDASLAGQPIAVATTQPYGCDVKYRTTACDPRSESERHGARTLTARAQIRQIRT